MKLKYEKPLSNIAFNFNLRHYNKGIPVGNCKLACMWMSKSLVDSKLMESNWPAVVDRIERHVPPADIDKVGQRMLRAGPGPRCCTLHPGWSTLDLTRSASTLETQT